MTAHTSSTEDLIKRKALEIGFNLCRITTAAPPPHHSYLKSWIDEGCNGEMQYLERHEPIRADLTKVVPDAKSVVVVAMSYSQSAKLQGESGAGVIARYARVPDYHNTMWELLTRLLAEIKSVVANANGRAFCDSAPISERDLAERAGIGWVGKHASLISRELGNWFFLGEIVLDIELEPDPPETKHCGSCSRCMPACPTGAITAPYHLDARRCIAYLTIELKGSIPLELRPLIGNRIFGCDDCLAVCPWNKFAKAATHPALQAKADLTNPDLVQLLTLTPSEFNTRFDGTPIKRTKRRGLLRNVCVALGNVGDASALPALSDSLHDDEPLVQEHAQWAIEQIEARGTTEAHHGSV